MRVSERHLLQFSKDVTSTGLKLRLLTPQGRITGALRSDHSWLEVRPLTAQGQTTCPGTSRPVAGDLPPSLAFLSLKESCMVQQGHREGRRPACEWLPTPPCLARAFPKRAAFDETVARRPRLPVPSRAPRPGKCSWLSISPRTRPLPALTSPTSSSLPLLPVSSAPADARGGADLSPCPPRAIETLRIIPQEWQPARSKGTARPAQPPSSSYALSISRRPLPRLPGTLCLSLSPAFAPIKRRPTRELSLLPVPASQLRPGH